AHEDTPRSVRRVPSRGRHRRQRGLRHERRRLQADPRRRSGAMLGSNEGAVTLLDANGSDFRTKEGVIPGAVLLSSYKAYDVERELPSRKDARLVFYCADSH